MPILRLRHYPLRLAVESDLYSWPGTRSSGEYCSGVSSLNGDPNLLQKMAEGKGFTRTCPETTKKERASGPNTPVVSMPMGTKWCVVCRSAYLAFFCCSACSATNPGSLEAKAMCEGARVLWYVASHTSTQPQLQGMIDIPSGRLPSERHKSVGSRWAGIPAADKYSG